MSTASFKVGQKVVWRWLQDRQPDPRVFTITALDQKNAMVRLAEAKNPSHWHHVNLIAPIKLLYECTRCEHAVLLDEEEDAVCGLCRGHGLGFADMECTGSGYRIGGAA